MSGRLQDIRGVPSEHIGDVPSTHIMYRLLMPCTVLRLSTRKSWITLRITVHGTVQGRWRCDGYRVDDECDGYCTSWSVLHYYLCHRYSTTIGTPLLSVSPTLYSATNPSRIYTWNSCRKSWHSTWDCVHTYICIHKYADLCILYVRACVVGVCILDVRVKSNRLPQAIKDKKHPLGHLTACMYVCIL